MCTLYAVYCSSNSGWSVWPASAMYSLFYWASRCLLLNDKPNNSTNVSYCCTRYMIIQFAIYCSISLPATLLLCPTCQRNDLSRTVQMANQCHRCRHQCIFAIPLIVRFTNRTDVSHNGIRKAIVTHVRQANHSRLGPSFDAEE